MKKKAGTRKEMKTPVIVHEHMPIQKDDSVQQEEHSFPIIGIGSSAGGLEALEQFLGAVPDKSGMAFVIVQHLDPNYKGIMTELLQRSTRMPVHQVEDQMTVQPDTVYIIPPNKDMSMLHGVLYLLEPSAPRGLRLPIDFFFRSLAEDLQEQSICVILSGMGSDGTAGLRAVKEKSGLVLVQEPGSAKFDGMPVSAIESGLADIVAPAYELPEKIISYLRHTPLRSSPEPIIEEKTQTALDKIIILMRRHTGHDFSPYKKSSVYRRIERRMGIHRIDRIAIYVRFLQENPKELDILFRELLIGVTSFFRDHLAWKHLQEKDIPSVLHTFQAGRTFRCWVAGCSTGEEAYSLAIVLREVLDKDSPEMKITVQIFATDLDQDAIDKARQGFYPENIVPDIPADRLNRYFTREDGGYRVSKAIREMVIFAPQNLIMDSPFIKLDIICCRNLLIYLEPGIQKKLFPLFHYALNPGGILFLGNAESIGSFTNLFTQSDAKWRIYRRNELIAGLEKAVEFPSTFTPHLTGVVSDYPATTPPVNIQSMTDELILKKYSPAAVLTTEKGDILYISGKTGKYLEPAAGRANWNIYAMAREGLRFELTGAFQKALREKGTVIVRNVKTGTDDNEQAVDITIQTIKDPRTLQGMLLIVFHDVAPLPKKKATARSRNQKGRNIREVELEQEIQKSRENLQIAREEMQTSQEELKSSNEELQSANEELQSTNEELMTSKEEMQSLNEELQTVNSELRERMSTLTQMNNDMKNLLNSTNIATIFLDNDLNVLRFTPMATTVIKLIPRDVGRPVTDLVSNLVYPDLPEDIRKVLLTLVFVEKEIISHDGRWFSVRTMPYRTVENKIDGVVITFTDITSFKQLEQDLTDARNFAEEIVSTVCESLIVLDPAMKVISANRSFYKTFRTSKEEVEGRIFYTLGDGQWDIPAFRKSIESVLPEKLSFENFKVSRVFPGIGHRVMLLNARKILSGRTDKESILLAIEDITPKGDAGQ